MHWSLDPSNGPGLADTWLYRSTDHGRSWTGPQKTGCVAVSNNIGQLSDGTLWISANHVHVQGNYDVQVVTL